MIVFYNLKWVCDLSGQVSSFVCDSTLSNYKRNFLFSKAMSKNDEKSLSVYYTKVLHLCVCCISTQTDNCLDKFMAYDMPENKNSVGKKLFDVTDSQLYLEKCLCTHSLLTCEEYLPSVCYEVCSCHSLSREMKLNLKCIFLRVYHSLMCGSLIFFKFFLRNKPPLK